MNPTLQWFHDTWLGAAMRASPWVYTAGLVIHFIGICLIVGTMLIVDLRLLGFIKRTPAPAALQLLPVALIGFAMNAITGLCFFCFDPVLYWRNPAFKIKLVLLVVAGLNALVFTVWEHRSYLAAPDDHRTTRLAQVTAGLSLTLWFFIIVCGRLIVAFQGSPNLFGGATS